MSASAAATTRRDACLGIHLGHREVGLAVATRERLVTAFVLNIRKIPSMDGRERRLRQVVGGLVDETGATRVAIVMPPARRGDNATFAAVIDDEALRRALPVDRLLADSLRASITLSGARPSNRAVACALVKRFPELRRCAPRVEPFVEGGRPPSRSAHERYHGRMFLALAAALVSLDEVQKAKLPL